MGQKETIRVAAVGDLHCTRNSAGALHGVFARASDMADVLVLCGDLTDYGTAEETMVLRKELSAAKVPVLAVLGNHDFESGTPDDVKTILREGGVTVLDGEACEVRGMGFAGAKGFIGGFGRGTLEAWGEPSVKALVQEAEKEALKLESALARLRTPQSLAILHYAPIAATVEGEPLEIYPYLGCSRLEAPLTRYPVSAVVHGHAHRGQVEGRTLNGIPVYNVAMPLLRRSYPDTPPFRILEFTLER